MGPSRCYATIINIFIELVDEFCLHFVLAHVDLSTSRTLERGAGALARPVRARSASEGELDVRGSGSSGTRFC